MREPPHFFVEGSVASLPKDLWPLMARNGQNKDKENGCESKIEYKLFYKIILR